ncbi:hypothetical protein [Dongia mobilis]|jgi:hypothetical protein|uniref:hypothetical protein n=1 Tax=Dongia sp. TaxID=1977262 RepID=UPI0026EA7028
MRARLAKAIAVTMLAGFLIGPNCQSLADDGTSQFPEWSQTQALDYDEQGDFSNFLYLNGATRCGQDKFLFMSESQQAIVVRHKSGRVLQTIDLAPMLANIFQPISAGLVCVTGPNSSQIGITIYSGKDVEGYTDYTNSISVAFDLESRKWSRMLPAVQFAGGGQRLYFMSKQGYLFAFDEQLDIVPRGEFSVFDAKRNLPLSVKAAVDILQFSAARSELLCVIEAPGSNDNQPISCSDIPASIPIEEDISWDWGHQFGPFIGNTLHFHTPRAAIAWDVTSRKCRTLMKSSTSANDLFFRYATLQDGKTFQLRAALSQKSAGKNSSNSALIEVKSESGRVVYDSGELPIGSFMGAELIALGNELFLMVYSDAGTGDGSILVKRIQ